MADALPENLHRLLVADAASRDAAWDAFVASYTRLLLHTTRSVARDHDAAMDAYAHVLAALRDDDFRRLRAYAPVPGSKFTTWLVMVARRLAVDTMRQRYGQLRCNVRVGEARRTRARLADLLADGADPDALPAPDGTNPESELRVRQVGEALDGALGELSAGDRLLLVLRFGDDRSARDIAALLNLPTPFHVYRRINAALAVLRGALLRRGVDGPVP